MNTQEAVTSISVGTAGPPILFAPATGLEKHLPLSRQYLSPTPLNQQTEQILSSVY